MQNAPPHGGVFNLNQLNPESDHSQETRGSGSDEVNHDEGATPPSPAQTSRSAPEQPVINETQNLLSVPALPQPDNSTEDTSDVPVTRSKRARSKRKRE